MITPGVEAVRESVAFYVKHYPDYADALRMYGAIMEVQQAALEEISCSLDAMSPEDVEASLRSGKPLLDPFSFEIDVAEFRVLAYRICLAIDKLKVGGFSYREELLSWEGLSDERFSDTRNKVLSGEKLDFVPTGESAERNLAFAGSILWEALVPFYRKSASIQPVEMEQSLWRRGKCPVCGCVPLMGKFRKEDGLWLVECSLCHTLWNVQRAQCPFCDDSHGSLEFLYLDNDESKRASYCKACKRYVKVVDLRDGGVDVLLPLEDIVTVKLDLAAKKKGLNRASGGY